MPHKDAQKLLDEVSELLTELEVLSVQQRSLTESAKALSDQYQSGKHGYLEYEQKQKALLRGRSREEWDGYFKASSLTLLKKAEFVVSQVTVLVQDDTSCYSLKAKAEKSKEAKHELAAQPAQKAAETPEQPQAAESRPEARIEVFNIDNEVERLRSMLLSSSVHTGVVGEVQQEAARGSNVSITVPLLEDVAKEIEEAEAKAGRAALRDMVKIPGEVNQPGAHRPGLGVKIAAMARNAAGLPLLTLTRILKAIGLIVAAAAKRKPALKTKQAPKITFSSAPAANRLPAPKQPYPQQRKGITQAIAEALGIRKAKRGIFVEEIVAMEKKAKESEKMPATEKKEPAGLAFGWFSIRSLLNEVTEKFRAKQGPIMAEKTAVPIHMKKLKEMRKKLYEEERLSGFDTTLLAQEAKRVKKILEVERPEVYQGSSIGLIANLTVRKMSLFLVDTFPEFFGFLYNALRAANVKVLSNTYVNIMILSTLFTTAAAFAILTILFFILNYPLYQIVLKTLIFSGIAGFACATIFYAYPFMKIKERRRNIMTNMPFAINHMAAVATSGVPPVSMFELISASKEYGEIGTEVKKVVDFTNIFGYDFLTALRTVAATTPSPHFKEFLEGVVSTIETGGDLDSYLRQEADQATLTYNLERQRYNETVSTYSDIYTGLLIAAPLFFVAAMALVNLLGGTLGGIGVDIVMAVGAYAVIPLLNIGFLVFLQLTQPDV